MNYAWNPDYKIGINKIDEQHENLFSILWDLSSDTYTKDCNKFLELVKRLEEDITVHFEFEEEIMRQYDYPSFKDHLKQHNNFREFMKKLREDKVTQEPCDTVGTLNILGEKLVDHIGGSDMGIGRYLNAKGVIVE